MIVDNNLISNAFIDRGPWNGQNKSGGFFFFLILLMILHAGLLCGYFLRHYGRHHVMNDTKCKENSSFLGVLFS